MPLARWQQFIDDCGRFLDLGWAKRAEAFGWGPLDLFGCDRERPLARYDHMGLLWIIQGRRLVALTADTATIGARTLLLLASPASALAKLCGSITLMDESSVRSAAAKTSDQGWC